MSYDTLTHTQIHFKAQFLGTALLAQIENVISVSHKSLQSQTSIYINLKSYENCSQPKNTGL